MFDYAASGQQTSILTIVDTILRVPSPRGDLNQVLYVVIVPIFGILPASVCFKPGLDSNPGRRLLPVSNSCIAPCLRWRFLMTRCSKRLDKGIRIAQCPGNGFLFGERRDRD